MRTTYILLAILFIATIACKKNNDIPDTTPNNDTSNSNSNTKADTIIRMQYDSVLYKFDNGTQNFPITIYNDADSPKNIPITIQLSHNLPIRCSAELTSGTGTTPLTTNIKVTTTLVPEFNSSTLPEDKSEYITIKVLVGNNIYFQDSIRLAPQVDTGYERKIYEAWVRAGKKPLSGIPSPVPCSLEFTNNTLSIHNLPVSNGYYLYNSIMSPMNILYPSGGSIAFGNDNLPNAIAINANGDTLDYRFSTVTGVLYFYLSHSNNDATFSFDYSGNRVVYGEMKF